MLQHSSGNNLYQFSFKLIYFFWIFRSLFSVPFFNSVVSDFSLKDVASNRLSQKMEPDHYGFVNNSWNLEYLLFAAKIQDRYEHLKG